MTACRRACSPLPISRSVLTPNSPRSSLLINHPQDHATTTTITTNVITTVTNTSSPLPSPPIITTTVATTTQLGLRGTTVIAASGDGGSHFAFGTGGGYRSLCTHMSTHSHIHNHTHIHAHKCIHKALNDAEQNHAPIHPNLALQVRSARAS